MKHEEELQSQPFAIVPTEVMMDTRLTLESMRVLVTLFSFRNKLTGIAFPSREAIAERCGMHPSNISAATTKLVELGWLSKDGKGGYGKATRYTITIPEAVTELASLHREKSEARKGVKVAERAMVAQQATVAEQATVKVAQSATPCVAQSATRIEQTNVTNQLTIKPLVAVATGMRCPVDKIVDLYHECMPNNPRVVRLNAARQASIKARWIECAKGIGNLFGYKTVEDGLEHWRNFFEICATSKFLTGQVAPAAGRKSFIADIDFLFRESSFTHILENKYHRDAA